ncbi:hypothetical protein F5888DRAFT_1618448 [Russula emetica]|nr:hypothetical protein F5888DRAFT_1618448 [Russula emetica]
MQEINHFLKPLVDDLLDSYVNGVRYTRTWKHPNGRNTRSTLALIICDLPAGRQALGFTGPQSANFCSYCKLQLKNINDLDVRSWEPRSSEEHRKLAFEWRDTLSDRRHAEITSKYGVRYSEFLWLPYLDPIRVLTVDTMHAFFLRILSRHCQAIWGMDSKIEDGDGLASDPVPLEIRSDMEKTTLPSYCSPAPPRIGDKGQGKISADGWRVFCTVHLIVTLGRLWGSLPADSHEKQLFTNLCDLIGATKIAAGRSISVARAEEFRDLMLRYLSGLDNLFPMHRLIPYHHLSIHLKELLSHFGPTTTWHCWVFERYNHMVQNIETNGRFGL